MRTHTHSRHTLGAAREATGIQCLTQGHLSCVDIEGGKERCFSPHPPTFPSAAEN